MPKRHGGFAKRDAKRQRKAGLLGGSAKFRSAVRKEILRTTETKMRTQEQGLTSLYHNNWHSSYWVAAVQRGDQISQRDGDELFLQRIVTKLHINSKPDRQSIMIRALLVKVPSHSGTVAANTLFEGDSNVILGFPDTREVTVLAQKIVKLQGGSTVWNTADSVQKDLSATVVLSANFYNRKVKYEGEYPRDFHVRLLVAAYDSHGSLTTDNIADYMASSRLYFKDP